MNLTRAKRNSSIAARIWLCVSLILLQFVLLSTGLPTAMPVSGCFDYPDVFITVSSLAKKVKGVLQDRLLEVNWNNLEPHIGDWVGLFSHDPLGPLGISDPLLVANVTITRGYVRSNERLDRVPLSPFMDPCLGYWIAHIDNDQVKLSNCLRIYPNWMMKNKDLLGEIPIHALKVPGTHNSGSWQEYDGNLDVFQRYVINQDESIYRQLVHGIRYLDIRVGYYPGSQEKFWINHNFYRMHPLSTLVDDVRQFVEETGEVVVLDFHRFPVGFNGNVYDQRHSELAEYLHAELGLYAAAMSLWPNANLNDIWGLNKTVIISYSEPKIAHKYPELLWPPLTQEWGDKRKLPELKGFLRDTLQKRGGSNQLWAAMAEFTPKPLDLVLRPTQGLRHMAQTVNIPMTYWFQEKSWYTKANVIATDFFLGNNIIVTSIISNFKGIKCSV